MQLHFSKDALPDCVSSDFHTLNKLSEQVRCLGADLSHINSLYSGCHRTFTAVQTAAAGTTVYNCVITDEPCVLWAGLINDKSNRH